MQLELELMSKGQALCEVVSQFHKQVKRVSTGRFPCENEKHMSSLTETQTLIASLLASVSGNGEKLETGTVIATLASRIRAPA